MTPEIHPAIDTASSPRPGVGFDPARPDFASTPASGLRPVYGYRPADPGAPPAVTVVTPFFNAGPVFRETATSVLRQSLQQWEWLIVDDGSKDPGALNLLEEYEGIDPRVRVVRAGRNGGLSAARNLGYREARADLVFQLDADDLIEPTTLEKLAWVLSQEPGVGFANGLSVGFGAKEYVWRHGFHDGPKFLEENLVTATAMIRKSVHEAVGGYDESNRGGLEDWDFWLRAAAKGYWGVTVAEVFDWYRRRDPARDGWDNLRSERRAAFGNALRARHADLAQNFPQPPKRPPYPGFVSARKPVPFANRLGRGDRPRLLFLVPHFEMGGADKFNLDLVRELVVRHRYEVTVVATNRSDHPWKHLFEGLTPDVFALDRFTATGDLPTVLRYFVESRRPDVVCISNSLSAYELTPFLRAHYPDLPIVDYLHMEDEAWFGGSYPRVSVDFEPYLSRTAVSSSHLRRWMCDRGAEASRIEVCTTNVDAGAWRRDTGAAEAVARRLGVDRSRPVVLYAGRICGQKQPGVFAEVVKRVAREYPAFTALVAGDGPDLPVLKAFVERERLSQVRFLGQVGNDAVREALSIADVFFLPSLWEGISLALYEAMAMEAVVLGADVGGQAELVTPECGILVRPGPGEVEAYAAHLLELLRSPEKRRSMARAARERVATHFRLEDLADRMHAIFGEARARAILTRAAVPERGFADLYASAVARKLASTAHADRLSEQLEEQARELARAPRAASAPPASPPPKAQPAQKAVTARPDASKARSGPLVSVVMPCYGQAEFLSFAVSSVALQSFKDWELIIVDDGSPDDTAATARKLIRQLPGRRIRLLRQKNQGVAIARNAGIEASRGKYIVPLDADDAIDREFLKVAVSILEADPGVSVVGTDSMTFGAREAPFQTAPEAGLDRLIRSNALNYCSPYRREVWEAVGGYNPNMTVGYEDWDFWIGVKEAGFRCIHVPAPLFLYRVKAESRDTNARNYDKALRCRIVLNHPGAYPPGERAEAEAFLREHPLPAHGERGKPSPAAHPLPRAAAEAARARAGRP